jgi:hypothetical protein
MQSLIVLENGQQTASYSKYLKVTGVYNYFVALDIKRKPGTTNSVIQAQCYTNSSRSSEVHVAYNWSHTSSTDNTRQSTIPVNTSFYQLSPMGILALNRHE